MTMQMIQREEDPGEEKSAQFPVEPGDDDNAENHGDKDDKKENDHVTEELKEQQEEGDSKMKNTND